MSKYPNGMTREVCLALPISALFWSTWFADDEFQWVVDDEGNPWFLCKNPQTGEWFRAMDVR